MNRSRTEGSLFERARLWHRARSSDAVIRLPFRLPHVPGDQPARRISLGAGTFIGPGAWLNVNAPDGRFSFGAGSSAGDSLTVSAQREVVVGEGCLLSARVCLLDALHDYESWLLPAVAAGQLPRANWQMTDPEPVHVGPGTWLGIGVVVMPGVRIGTGCVVGANSVVTSSLPDFTVAAGAPARVLRRVDERVASDRSGS